MVKELENRGYDVRVCDIADECDAIPLFGGRYDTVYDLVVHCAYLVGGRAAIDGRNMNLALNLQLDSAMFDWAVRTQQKRVLYFSSSAAYPVYFQRSHDNGRLRETDFTGMDADVDYGYAKCVGERVAQRARENGVPVSVVRPFSGYGADQSTDYPFPSIVRRAAEGDLSVWGPSGQTRDWIHISDIIQGALAVVDSETTDPVNLCTGRGVEMGELLASAYMRAHNTSSFSMDQIQYQPEKPTGVFYRVGDPTRMQKYYTPQVSLEEGIAEALEAIRGLPDL